MNASPAPIRLLPGALLPDHWLAGQPLDTDLPTIAAALRGGALRMADQPLPDVQAMQSEPVPAWAHDRWLATRPPFVTLQLSAHAVGAVRRLILTRPATEPTCTISGSNSDPDRNPDSSSESGPRQTQVPGNRWLLYPVKLHPTTDSIVMDAQAGRRLDAQTAERLVASIRPLLAEDGFAVDPLTPDCWLLKPLEPQTDWQLRCTAIEAVGARHIDALLPAGPDARRFRRLLNEIQMNWHRLSGPGDDDPPVNAVWLAGPVPPDAIWRTEDLAHTHGLTLDERFLNPRLQYDLNGWRQQLPCLDRLYADSDPKRFACLLTGEHQARWLFAPGSQAVPTAVAAAADAAARAGSSQPGTGLIGHLRQWWRSRSGRTNVRQTGTPLMASGLHTARQRPGKGSNGLANGGTATDTMSGGANHADIPRRLRTTDSGPAQTLRLLFSETSETA
ncbi:MAG: hypothetical protein Q4A16_04465 [Lautropia sp.]|nr:hypothetical protein [Lautropia sp.]